MICINNKADCCGCGSCVEICPRQCISFKEDAEGFMYPEVNMQECIECGLCEKRCPVLSEYKSINYTREAYGAYIKDESARAKSSSGGIFGAIAESVLLDGGFVCGAAFDEEFQVSHVMIDSLEQLDLLRGSKYLQSSNKGIYTQVKKKLVEGKTVLYSGTACQVAGLKKYLAKEYDKLITIDVLCHGVPSPKLWKKYIDELSDFRRNRIDNVMFRNKNSGWKSYSVKIDLADGNGVYEKYPQNQYMRLFLSNICLRPSCHSCKYKSMERPSDITMGDFWGIEQKVPELDDDKGTSVIQINTAKGKAIFNKITSNLVYQKVDIDVALPPTADSRKSVNIHPKREKFFRQLDKKDVQHLIKLIEPSLLGKIKKKIIRK